MHYPKHVAIIPDGNRTRARENDKTTQDAYMESYQRGVEIVQHTFTNTDVQVLTLRGLSTENVKKRSDDELNFLMTMYKMTDDTLDQILLDNNVNFARIGNPDGITTDFKNYLDEKVAKTKCTSNKYFILAINYGGRDEIIRGIQSLAKQGGNMHNVSEADLTNSLELSSYPSVELVIRTKGDHAHRTSGLMSWRIGYAELYFTNKMCPAFAPADFDKALQRFDQQYVHRNFGK